MIFLLHLTRCGIFGNHFDCFFFFKFQDEFASMRDNYYRNSHGFVLCYSVDQKSSLEDVQERFNGILTAKVRFANF